MNSCFERMKKLLEGTGISFNENGISNAEIYAYSEGLTFVFNRLRDIFNSIFINLSDDCSLDKYVEFLKIDTSGISNKDIKKLICSRLSEQFGNYTMDIFTNAFKGIGSGQYRISENGIVFSNVDKKDYEKLGRFIESYVCVCVQAGFDGEGLTFDDWDNWNKTFYEYDNLKFTFNIIDNLRSDNL